MAKKRATPDALAAFSTRPTNHPKPELEAPVATPAGRPPEPVPPAPQLRSPVESPSSAAELAGVVAVLSDLVRDLHERLAESQRQLLALTEREVELREENAGLRALLDAERDARRSIERELEEARRDPPPADRSPRRGRQPGEPPDQRR